MKIGIEFTMKDGTKESYDPIDYEKDFKEDKFNYGLELSNGYSYWIIKKDVESIRKYNLCGECGYEEVEGVCTNYGCINNPF